VITREELLRKGLDWLFETSLFLHLPPTEEDAILREAEFAHFDADHVIIDGGSVPGHAHIIIEGQVAVSRSTPAGRHRVLARLGPGHLFGEVSALHGSRAAARVRSLSPVGTLALPREAFRRLLGDLPALRGYVEGLVAIRERSDDLVPLLASHGALRLLGREDLDRLLQTARLIRAAEGTRIIEGGAQSDEVFFLLRGRAGAMAPGAAPGEPPLAEYGPGSLIGERAALLQAPRAADVVVSEESELLVLPGRALLGILEKNPRALRRLAQQVSAMSSPVLAQVSSAHRALRVLVCAAERGLGSTSVAYGVAAAARDPQRSPPLVIDLDGPRTAQTLSMEHEVSEIAGIRCRRLRVPPEWRVDVVWPVERAQAAALLQDPAAGREFVIASASPQAKDAESIAAEADAIVFVSRSGEDVHAVPDRRGQFRVWVRRVDPTSDSPAPDAAHTVRLLPDARTPQEFRTRGELAVLTDPRSPFGRASRRLVRILRGRAVGLALGGGGAWGFAHIGLLRALERHGVPVDYVAGTSFGSVVAGLYAAGGLPALETLVRRRAALWPLLLASFGTTRPLGWMMDRLLGDGCRMGGTEIPFLPVSTDIALGTEAVLPEGSVGTGIRASSGMPGLFPPLHAGEQRLVDGGVVNNVPASVVWSAGADFVVAVNVIPARPGGRTARGGITGRINEETFGRIDDLLRSMYLLMHRNGMDRAREADFTLDLADPAWTIMDFHRGASIAQSGEERAEAEMERLLRAWRNDRTVHIGRREA
jgi:predicted acylesterase/phospholipase RssA/CRP-like cAMP-binding protein